MNPTNDPRVFFAAERTLLAWINSGLAVMGFGFVVARFGLFLRMLERTRESAGHHPASTFLGVGLILLGVIAVLAAAIQHARFLRTLGPADRPAHFWPGLSIAFASALAAMGLTMALFLLIWTGPN